MTLIKTSVLTAISTIIKVVTGFVINKVLALYVGPSGLAAVGQLQNFISIVTTFSNGAITNGIVKHTAEYKNVEQKQKIFSTSIIISLVCSSIISVLLFRLSDYLSELILKDSQYSSVFMVLGITILLFALNTILMSILNGQKEIKKYVLINIVSSLFSLVFTSFLIMQLNLVGALYALVVNQSVIFFVTLVFVVKSSWFELGYFTQGIDKESLIKLSKYSLMAITSAITVPVSHLIVRNYIGENLSWDDAGYWQGLWYISSAYLLLVTTSLRVYYLPKLSSINNDFELKKEIFYGYKILSPIIAISALSIYFFRYQIVEIAFTKDFLQITELFTFQLIGDALKIFTFIFGFIFLAKAMIKIYIFFEIIGAFSFIFLSIFFVDYFGLIGITYAYALNYLIYLTIMIFYFRKVLR